MSEDPFKLIYAPATKEHLKGIDAKYHSLIADKIKEQLLHQPSAETRNRKRLREPILAADWELRFGPGNRFRVLYRISEEKREVDILGIAVKDRDRLILGEEEVEL